MRALLSRRPGPPETLELCEVPDPTAGPGQIVISIKAAAVNYPDALIIEDRYQVKPGRPFAPGCEMAGTVAAVGEGVSRFQAGDRVIGSAFSGGFAEQIAIDAAKCVSMPPGMPFTEAAAFLLTYGTSYYALKDRASLRAGETVLVLGAAGGVGVAAVEIGKAMGAKVIAAVSGADKAAFARSCGADDVLIYPQGPLSKEESRALTAEIKQITGGGADVTYDAVGGEYCEAALRAMNFNGRHLVVGFPAGIPAPPLNLVLLKSCSLVGVFWGAWVAREPQRHEENLRDLFALYTGGKIRPRVSATFPLADGARAIRSLVDRRATGKVVIVME